MAVPKRRTSAAKRDSRRSQWKAPVPTVVECSHCHEPKLPHRVCPSCGYYNDKPVLKRD